MDAWERKERESKYKGEGLEKEVKRKKGGKKLGKTGREDRETDKRRKEEREK